MEDVVRIGFRTESGCVSHPTRTGRCTHVGLVLSRFISGRLKKCNFLVEFPQKAAFLSHNNYNSHKSQIYRVLLLLCRKYICYAYQHTVVSLGPDEYLAEFMIAWYASSHSFRKAIDYYSYTTPYTVVVVVVVGHVSKQGCFGKR